MKKKFCRNFYFGKQIFIAEKKNFSKKKFRETNFFAEQKFLSKKSQKNILVKKIAKKFL